MARFRQLIVLDRESLSGQMTRALSALAKNYAPRDVPAGSQLFDLLAQFDNGYKIVIMFRVGHYRTITVQARLYGADMRFIDETTDTTIEATVYDVLNRRFELSDLQDNQYVVRVLSTETHARMLARREQKQQIKRLQLERQQRRERLYGISDQIADLNHTMREILTAICRLAEQHVAPVDQILDIEEALRGGNDEKTN
jgi:hypothetical protein